MIANGQFFSRHGWTSGGEKMAAMKMAKEESVDRMDLDKCKSDHSINVAPFRRKNG